MIYTVSFNPSLDYIVDVEDFTVGRVNRTNNEIMFPGGKGINVSLVLSNLGIPNLALGFIAGFTGAAIEKMVAARGVHSDFIKLDEGLSRVNVKLRSNEETEINGQGPVIEERHIEQLKAKLKSATENDFLVLAGSIPSCMPKSIYMDIMKELKGRGINIVVDATGELLLNVVPYSPFLIKPNIHELGELFGVTIKDKETTILYAKKLREMGARNVLVSMAGDGAILVTEDNEVLSAKAPRGELRNSVGAGDSMVAGFIAGYTKSGSYEDAFKMGVCTGSASAFSDELATKEEVYRLLEKMS